jgi:hypothetical protein
MGSRPRPANYRNARGRYTCVTVYIPAASTIRQCTGFCFVLTFVDVGAYSKPRAALCREIRALLNRAQTRQRSGLRLPLRCLFHFS